VAAGSRRAGAIAAGSRRAGAIAATASGWRSGGWTGSADAAAAAAARGGASAAASRGFFRRLNLKAPSTSTLPGATCAVRFSADLAGDLADGELAPCKMLLRRVRGAASPGSTNETLFRRVVGIEPLPADLNRPTWLSNVAIYLWSSRS